MKIILASNSPRRKELLQREGVEFTVIPSDYKECDNFGLTPEKYVEFLAYNKAKAVLDKTGEVVIGADTVVVLDSDILGKPKNENDAAFMLEKLSGKTSFALGRVVAYSKPNSSNFLVILDLVTPSSSAI